MRWLWWLENTWRVCSVCAKTFGVVVGPPSGPNSMRDQSFTHTSQYAFSTAELPGGAIEIE